MNKTCMFILYGSVFREQKCKTDRLNIGSRNRKSILIVMLPYNNRSKFYLCLKALFKTFVNLQLNSCLHKNYLHKYVGHSV